MGRKIGNFKLLIIFKQQCEMKNKKFQHRTYKFLADGYLKRRILRSERWGGGVRLEL